MASFVLDFRLKGGTWDGCKRTKIEDFFEGEAVAFLGYLCSEARRRMAICGRMTWCKLSAWRNALFVKKIRKWPCIMVLSYSSFYLFLPTQFALTQ